jgi:hypothetical protein
MEFDTVAEAGGGAWAKADGAEAARNPTTVATIRVDFIVAPMPENERTPTTLVFCQHRDDHN